MRKVLFILGQLTDEDVEWLAGAGRRERVAAGSHLIREGAAVDAIYILLDGRMAVSVQAIGEIAVLRTGEIVGEMSLVDARPPSATVTAATDCQVLAVPRVTMDAKLRDDGAFAARFYKAIATFLADRLRGTVHRLGYGVVAPTDDDAEADSELDLNVLDHVHLAGARFDRILKKLAG
ncbi:MAG: cyclic nucleotide-binding domain-containing protein [Alphaproteobacteria bacterium]|nr:cyclic nucleotide-binding domain-containing protein [Alphaproteobacteria bacterium]